MSKWRLNSALLMDTLFEPIGASYRGLQSAVAKEHPVLAMGPPYFDGQYICQAGNWEKNGGLKC